MKFKARHTVFALCLVWAMALSACVTVQKPKPQDGQTPGEGLTFITGNEQGTYYRFGGVLAQKISDTTSTALHTVSSGGSKDNIEALEAGDAQVAFVQSDVLGYAYDGTRLFKEKADEISVVAQLYKEQVQIVTMDPKLKSVADLRGKSVSIGASGSGVYFNAIDILEAYGITEKDISPTYQSFSDSVEALQSGKIDAAFVVAGAPTSAISGLAATTNVYLIGLDDEHIGKLIESSPQYSRVTVSKKLYNTPTDIETVAVGALLVVRDDLPEEDVYNIISGIYENLMSITVTHSKGAELSLETASSVAGIPYHKGAARYYSEKGITVAVK